MNHVLRLQVVPRAHWLLLVLMLGAALLYSLPEVLRPLQDFRLMTNGLLLVIAAVYLPRGLSDPALWAWARLRWRSPRDG